MVQSKKYMFPIDASRVLCRGTAIFLPQSPELFGTSHHHICITLNTLHDAREILMVNRLRLFKKAACSLTFLLLSLACLPAAAQSASINGLVTDSTNAVLPKVTVELLDTATHTKQTAVTNSSGFYTIPNVMPGEYTVNVTATGFETESRTNVTVTIGAKVTLNFALKVGSQTEQVTVDGSQEELNTTDASVSTVVNRNFVENLPLNGRSFQSLITLSPGVIVVPSAGVGSSGEISVNGQRTEANYYTIDGISANTGASVSSAGYPGGGFSGATPQESALGTTQSIVSIDALEEFRESTSSYSAEYGRTPGGQFSFSTRSGTNTYHGTLFDYLRNDALDAQNFFDLTKLPERQNDFGGTFGGAIRIPHLYDGRDKSFFFFSYEGLRLVQPQAAQLYEVPSNTLRQTAPAALQPFLDAFPTTSSPDVGNGLAYLTVGYTAPSRLDTTSIRIDHSFSDRFKIFGRYSYVPSQSESRQPTDLAQVNNTVRNIQTFVFGASSIITPNIADEFRFGFTTNGYNSNRYLDNFGGATPFDIGSVPGLNNGSWLTFFIFYDLYPYYLIEPQSNTQHQFNVVDSLTWNVGRHSFKYGVDYRLLITQEALPPLWEVGFFTSEAAILANNPAGLYVYTQAINMDAHSSNFSLYAQDEWKATPRLSVSYGVRWDINPPPFDGAGNTPYTLNQITDLSTAVIAPKNTPLWQTTYGNFAPRLGIAYQLNSKAGMETVLRAGGGLFYDTGTTLSAEGYYGVGTTGFGNYTPVQLGSPGYVPGADPFPATAAQVQGAPLPNALSPYNAAVFAFDTHLKLPYTGEWNVAVEQALGTQQSLTFNYVASAGRRLLAQFLYYPENLPTPNENFSGGSGLYVTTNAASSDYNSLQVKFERKLSHGLQFLASYTWSHAIDNATTNFTIFQLERASSDYDIRNNFQTALSYNVGGHYSSRIVDYALTHWAFDARISARSALPVDILDGPSIVSASSGASTNYHPDRVPNTPLYLYGPQYSSVGGRVINFNAFTPGPTGGDVDGNAGRNIARGFDAVQTDLTLRRDFPITQRVGLQFRVEAYNIFNHPIFGDIYNQLASGASLFGQAYDTESTQLGGLSSLYQVGGPRSLQLALKLHF
ncbi:MAG: TonB-dependent receptor [Acidobacteriaceae bacterium]